MKQLIITGIILSLISCRKDNTFNCFVRSGEIIKEERLVEEFSSLHIYDEFEVFFINGSVEKLTIEGGKNLIPGISTKVEDNKLTIRNEIKCDWIRSYKNRIKIHIPVDSLKEFKLLVIF